MHEQERTVVKNIDDLQASGYFYTHNVSFALSELKEVPYQDFQSLQEDLKRGLASFRVSPNADYSKQIYTLFARPTDKFLIITAIALSVCAAVIGVSAFALGQGSSWLGLLFLFLVTIPLIKMINSRAVIRAAESSEIALCTAYCLHLIEIETPSGEVLVRGVVPLSPWWIFSFAYRKLRLGLAYGLFLFLFFIVPVLLGTLLENALDLEWEHATELTTIAVFIPWFLFLVTQPRRRWVETCANAVAHPLDRKGI